MSFHALTSMFVQILFFYIAIRGSITFEGTLEPYIFDGRNM